MLSKGELSFLWIEKGNLVTAAIVYLLQAKITGNNTQPMTFLSAGDIPKPYLFFTIFAIYLGLSFVWLRVLRKAT